MCILFLLDKYFKMFLVVYSQLINLSLLCNYYIYKENILIHYEYQVEANLYDISLYTVDYSPIEIYRSKKDVLIFILTSGLRMSHCSSIKTSDIRDISLKNTLTCRVQ